MKAVLKYTDCLQDGRKVFNILAIRNIEILKTRQDSSCYPQITIRVKDNNELNQLIAELNKKCSYEVRVVKVKTDNMFFKILNIIRRKQKF